MADEQAARVAMYSSGVDLANLPPLGGLASAAKVKPDAAAAAPLATAADDNDAQKALNDLEAKVVQAGMVVRTLKKDGKPFQAELAELNRLKELRDAAAKALQANKPKFDIDGLQNLIARKMIVVPAFEIHGGVAGLMDFGPPGVGLKDNIVDVWKKHFILREGMLQVECTNITPHSVLNASGHVARFNDLLCEELDEEGKATTGEYHRADKILEAHIEALLEKGTAVPNRSADELRKLANGADSLSAEEMDRVLAELDVRGPETGRKLSPARPFNLMFATSIGPSGNVKAYLRPETAQGIFVNFKRLLEYNNGRMPFASAQVGTGFRNEIAPKGGLIRVREFCMAEIEHFVHPERKQHARFGEVAEVVLQLFTAAAQTTTFEMQKVAVGEAVKRGMINNETLAYFMARSQQFFVKIGVDPARLRFRQHLPTEMAHYASDCYDAEILLNQGWLECAGHADRACYDLTAHTQATKVELVASERIEPPRVDKVTELAPNKKLIGSSFKQKAAHVFAYIASLDAAQCERVDAELAKTGKHEFSAPEGPYVLTRDMVAMSKFDRAVHEERYAPTVIEPSFGIGRIVYAVLEHSFWIRGEQAATEDRDLSVLVRNVLSLSPLVAPTKVGIIPYGASNDVEGARAMQSALLELELAAMVDSTSATIGKKYSKFDEIGVPLVVTLDDDSVKDGCVTLRHRDSEEQVRLPKRDVAGVALAVCKLGQSWADAVGTKWPEVRKAECPRRF